MDHAHYLEVYETVVSIIFLISPFATLVSLPAVSFCVVTLPTFLEAHSFPRSICGMHERYIPLNGDTLGPSEIALIGARGCTGRQPVRRPGSQYVALPRHAVLPRRGDRIRFYFRGKTRRGTARRAHATL